MKLSSCVTNADPINIKAWILLFPTFLVYGDTYLQLHCEPKFYFKVHSCLILGTIRDHEVKWLVCLRK